MGTALSGRLPGRWPSRTEGGGMSSRSGKQRRRQHRKEKKQRRSASSGPHPAPLGKLIVSNPPAVHKMSEVLEDFVAPEWDQAQGEDDMRKILTIGMLAWNLA